MRSGQNDTSIVRVPRLEQLRSTIAVTPGYTVLRRMRMLAVAELVEQSLDRPQDEPRVRVEVLVDRRADDDHDVLGLADRRRVVGRLEPAGGEDPLEQLVGAVLEERHLARRGPGRRPRASRS